MKYLLFVVLTSMVLVGCSTLPEHTHDSDPNEYNRTLEDITIDPAPSPVDPAVPGTPIDTPKPNKFG